MTPFPPLDCDFQESEPFFMCSNVANLPHILSLSYVDPQWKLMKWMNDKLMKNEWMNNIMPNLNIPDIFSRIVSRF